MASAHGRREFFRFAAGAAVGTVGIAGLPTILTAKKTDSPLVLGEGEYKYEVTHDWPQLPGQFTWQTTQDIAIDKAGNVYVIHQGDAKKPDHPSIFVFDTDGKYVRSFGSEFQGGGHGIEVHQEGGEEFLYVTGYQAVKKFAKLSLDGKKIWERNAPMESGVYAKGEDTNRKAGKARNKFQPTNIAFKPDGSGFYLTDGYGAYVVHVYDADANYKSTFGKPGKGIGEFDLPHGVWTDTRPGREPSVVVTDRLNNRLQWFTPDGKHLETLDGFVLPANVDTHGELMLVPELQSRVTLLDGKNQVVARFGDDAEWRTKVEKDKVRQYPAQWPNGKFIHPHDACFDADGNIFVCEWVATGRISKLRKV